MSGGREPEGMVPPSLGSRKIKALFLLTWLAWWSLRAGRLEKGWWESPRGSHCVKQGKDHKEQSRHWQQILSPGALCARAVLSAWHALPLWPGLTATSGEAAPAALLWQEGACAIYSSGHMSLLSTINEARLNWGMLKGKTKNGNDLSRIFILITDWKDNILNILG